MCPTKVFDIGTLLFCLFFFAACITYFCDCKAKVFVFLCFVSNATNFLMIYIAAGDRALSSRCRSSEAVGSSPGHNTVFISFSQNMILNALKTEYIYNTEYIQKHIKILTKTKYFKIGTEKNFQEKNWSNKIFCD